jgi:hypothetical protein
MGTGGEVSEFINALVAMDLCPLGERLGSADGEQEASMTQHTSFEPLPASVLSGIACNLVNIAGYSGSNVSVPVTRPKAEPMGARNKGMIAGS